MKTVAIIQARLGSTRLPHKVLQDIAGKTMIQRVVERVERCETIDEVVIATSTEPADQLLIEYCQSNNWNWFAGSEKDVLSRYVDAAHQYEADQIVRITSDCPLLEPSVVDKVVRLLSTDREIDYGCNFFPQRWFPRGLDCEVFTRSTLRRIDLLANERDQREHVTLYAYRNSEHFWLASTQAAEDYSKFRWTVDTEEDLELVREIYQHFGEQEFTWRCILDAYELFPHWNTINQEVVQKPTSPSPPISLKKPYSTEPVDTPVEAA